MLSALAGSVVTALFFSALFPRGERDPSDSNHGRVLDKPSIASERLEAWRPDAVASPSNWCFVRFDQAGWSTSDVGSYDDLRSRLGRHEPTEYEIAIPVLETVFRPDPNDKIYYDAIFRSDIDPGDKVLVVGPGSGTDAWAVSLKSGGPVHVIDANPMAVTNTLVTAQLGGFEVKPLVGDICSAELPDDFGEFDYVLWNMPFVKAGANATDFESRNFHDGDDGTLLQDFLARLPSLLAEDGLAILLNDPLADDLVEWPDASRKVAPAIGSKTPIAMLFYVAYPRDNAPHVSHDP